MQMFTVRSCLLVGFLTLCGAEDRRSDHYHPQGHGCSKFKREGGNDVLIYPNEAASHTPRPPRQNTSVVESSNRAGFAVEVDPAPCPDGQAYCESDDDYPMDLIKELLKDQPKSLLGHFNIQVEEDTDTGNRFGPGGDELELCPSNVKVIYPKKAKANDNMFEFVINTDDYRQGVRIEECAYANECTIPGSLSLGYSSRCVQKKIVRTLVVFNKDSTVPEGFVTKPFEFPSCCACHVTMSPAADRFGLPAEDPISSMYNESVLKPTKN